MNWLINELITDVFVEQPLASPGSANNENQHNPNKFLSIRPIMEIAS